MDSHKLQLTLLPEKSWYSFYRRLSGLQSQFGHKDMKKNLQPADIRIGTSHSSQLYVPYMLTDGLSASLYNAKHGPIQGERRLYENPDRSFTLVT